MAGVSVIPLYISRLVWSPCLLFIYLSSRKLTLQSAKYHTFPFQAVFTDVWEVRGCITRDRGSRKRASRQKTGRVTTVGTSRRHMRLYDACGARTCRPWWTSRRRARVVAVVARRGRPTAPSVWCTTTCRAAPSTTSSSSRTTRPAAARCPTSCTVTRCPSRSPRCQVHRRPLLVISSPYCERVHTTGGSEDPAPCYWVTTPVLASEPIVTNINPTLAIIWVCVRLFLNHFALPSHLTILLRLGCKQKQKDRENLAFSSHPLFPFFAFSRFHFCKFSYSLWNVYKLNKCSLMHFRPK